MGILTGILHVAGGGMDGRRFARAMAAAACFAAISANACHAELATGRPHYCDAAAGRILIAAEPGASGVTSVSFPIKKNGWIENPVVVGSSGNAAIDAASLECVRPWHYLPATQDRKPVEAQWTADLVWNPSGIHPLLTRVLRDCGQQISLKEPGAFGRKTEFSISYDDSQPDHFTITSVVITNSSGVSAIDEAEANCIANSKPEIRETVVTTIRKQSESPQQMLPIEAAASVTASITLARASATGEHQSASDPAPGEWREGAKEVPAALETDPIAMIVGKAYSHELLHNYDLAAKEFGMAIARFPDRPDFYRNRCWGYVMAEMHYDLAVADCEKAVVLKTQQSHPDSDIFFLRAQAYGGNRQYEAAIADYDKSESMGEANGRLRLYRCETYAQWGQGLRKGWNDCASYINKTGPDVRSLEAMALIRWRMKDYVSASDQADKSIAIYAKRAPALFLRGVAKRAAGNTAGGDADIAAAKVLDPKIAETYAGYGVTP